MSKLRLVVLGMMGRLLRAEARLPEAEQMYLEALRIREAALGKDAPRVADSLGDVANIKVALGQPAAARPLLERALQIFTKVYGPDHSRTQSTARALASLKAP